jgi:hypothetical protein
MPNAGRLLPNGRSCISFSTPSVTAIDSKPMLLHVIGKGNKQSSTALSTTTWFWS